jgi:hypothetical protein
MSSRGKLPPPVAPPARPLVLCAVSGDDVTAGEEFPIPHTEPLPVGRAAKGIQLTDPLVSIHHAEVFYDPKRGYVVQDLKSATGTWVDEESVRGDSRPIGVGTRLRFGDTVFEVRPANSTPHWVRWIAASAGGLLVVALGVFAAQQFVEPPVPELGCPDSGLVGAVGIKSLRVPPGFLRERGIVLSDLVCHRTTDEDDDGRVEAWLRHTDGREFVVAPSTAAGEWTLLGELPPHCTARGAETPGEFPILDCAGEEWMFVDGAYRYLRQEGVVVWYRELAAAEPEKPEEPTAPVEGEGPKEIELPGALTGAERAPIKVGRFALRGDRLGAFLSFRGVDRPIHYLICEEAFEGIAAQALMDDEGVSQLRIGCISDLRLLGSTPAKPIAIALTPAGRRALVDDVTTFYAGNPDGLFLDPRWEEVAEQIRAEPGFLVGARKLVGDTKESDAPPMSPFPDPTRTVSAAHVLEPRDSRLSAAPIATSVSVLKEGDALVDPPGCAQLALHTEPFVRYGFSSVLSRPFLTVQEVGCGDARTLATVGYTGGVTELDLEGLEARVVTEVSASARGLEISRARLSWREPKKKK